MLLNNNNNKIIIIIIIRRKKRRKRVINNSNRVVSLQPFARWTTDALFAILKNKKSWGSWSLLHLW